MTKPSINIIVAISKITRAIGKDNGLLWRISDDLKHLKSLTTGHPIIMGRKTFESIGRPLPNRTNIVITRNKDLKIDGVVICNSLDEAVQKATEIDSNIFILGGAEIYKQAIGITDRLYLTVINEEKGGDSFFPAYDDFDKIISSENKTTDTGLEYQWLVLEK